MRRVRMSLRSLRYRLQVHVIVRVRVGFCAVRAHERFGQCASAVSLCSTSRGQEHVIMRSRALCSRALACTDEFVYENQYLSTVLASQDFVLLCTSVQCEPPRAFYSVLVVLAPQGFVLLCTSVQCEPKRPLCGASLQRIFSSVYCTSSKSFVRCKPTKALCFVVLYEFQKLCAVRAYKGFIQCAPGLVLLCTVRAPRALRGASLQRLCASVYRTSPKSFA